MVIYLNNHVFAKRWIEFIDFCRNTTVILRTGIVQVLLGQNDYNQLQNL